MEKVLKEKVRKVKVLTPLNTEVMEHSEPKEDQFKSSEYLRRSKGHQVCLLLFTK